MSRPLKSQSSTSSAMEVPARIPYQYRPLKEGEIRLLEIFPGEETETISSRLIHVSLDDPGIYEAISYSWGEEKPDRSVDIGGQCLYVSPTVEHALKEIRRPGSELWERYKHPTGTRRIWIDAICINQADLKERSEQIKRMLEIYSNSVRLVIWIGYETDDSELALSFMQSFANIEALTGFRASRREFFRQIHTTSQLFAAIFSFFTRPWFGRAWTIQEFLAGTIPNKRYKDKNAIMLCGHAHSMANSVISFGFRLAEAKFMEGAFEIAGLEANMNCIQCRLLHDQYIMQDKLRTDSGASKGGKGGDSLLFWLNTIRISKGEPRDKIYSALGLADLSVQRGYDPDLLIIDYSVDVPSIYSSLVESIGATTKDLSVLLACGRRGEQIKSTWVPDWSMRDASYTALILSDRMPARFTRDAVEGTWAAAKGYPCIVSFDGGLRTMTARGIAIDFVEYVFKSPHWPLKNMPKMQKNPGSSYFRCYVLKSMFILRR